MNSINAAEQLAELRRATTTGEARAIRERSHLTRADVARALSVNPSNVSRWESGQRLPRGPVARQYLNLLRRLDRIAA